MKKYAAILALCFLWALPGKSQQDSIGVYSILDNTITRMDMIKYSSTKIKSAIVSAKASLQFDGQTSKNVFTEKAVFLVYFGVPAAYDAANYFMFSPSYSIKDFGVAEFKVKKGRRLLATSTVSIVGAKIGVKSAKNVLIESEKLKDNVYKVTVVGPPGEYCFAPIINGNMGFTGVYDFSIR